jgi:hypothetical protein
VSSFWQYVVHASRDGFAETTSSPFPVRPDTTEQVLIEMRLSFALGGKWAFVPLFEWRTGFPWSAVDEYQDFVGTRNARAGC